LIEPPYERIIKEIKIIISSSNGTSIRELIESNSLSMFDYEDLIASIKFLISSSAIIISKKSHLFKDNEVKWNSKNIDIKIPQKELLKIDSTRICATFPPFNTSGLINQMKDHQIQMNSLVDEFNYLFSRAKSTIKICSPFLEYNGFNFFKEVLIKKAKMDVKIKILSRQIKLNEKNTRYFDIEKLYKVFDEKGLKKKIEIRNYYYQSKERLTSSIHAKLIIIDDNLAYIGSGEIRKNSFEKNLELGVIISGSKVTELSLLFDKLFSKSEVVIFE